MDTSNEGNELRIKHNTALISLECKLRAAIALDESDKRGAIYYQTLSLGASKRQKYSAGSRQFNDLGDVIKNISKNEPTKHTDSFPSAQDGYEELCKRCRELPEEWTVLQIAKEFTPVVTCLTHEEQLKESTPVWLTVFRCSDPIEGNRSKPILLVLDPPADEPGCKYPNFFEHITSIPAEVRNAITNTGTTQDESQANRLEAVEQLINMAVNRIRDWLGPWSNLFVGKFRSQADLKLEAEIYNQVEDFCIQNQMNRTAQRLVSLVARRLDLLQESHVFELCCSEQLDLNETQSDALYALLSDIKKRKFTKQLDRIDSYPVLLVVDELLDSMPWEMIHPTGEFSRLASFWVLSELHRVHQKQIKNGYLSVTTNNCFAIINPDKSLQKMSTRLQLFYKEWYPDFRLLVDQPPTETELSDVLNQSDVLIYNGHGSGLQFMNGESLLQRDINSVTFLFGCDSVRLYSNGLFTEMTGTHLYYNAARCPTVVGSLWVLTDLYTDIYSMLLVGNWIPSTNAKYSSQNIASIDTIAFKSAKWQFNKSSSTRLSLKKHPNLLKLMGDCRLFHHLPQRIRCAMVCRGLPAINELCS